MSSDKHVAKSDSTQVEKVANQNRPIIPAVDIYEDAQGIYLKADMPGVSKNNLDIQINNDTLSINGEMEIPVSERMEALYADIRSKRYQRSFSISRELDSDKIDASLNDGVLTMHIPKRDQFQSRKIEVQVE